MLNFAMASGARATAKTARAVGIVTSSKVRMEMMQATSCSKTESKPSLAS